MGVFIKKGTAESSRDVVEIYQTQITVLSYFFKPGFDSTFRLSQHFFGKNTDFI